MSYLLYVAVFGAAGAFFLWLRDARIFYRTGLAGYRKAAYWGVAYSALATFGVACTMYMLDLLGLGLILGALYLQVGREREKIWENEGTIQRLLGSVPKKRASKK